MIIGPVIETQKIGPIFYSALLGMNLAGAAVVLIGAHNRESDEPFVFDEAADLVEARAKILNEAIVSTRNQTAENDGAPETPKPTASSLENPVLPKRLFNANEVIGFSTTAISLAFHWEAVLEGNIKTVDRKRLQQEAQSYQQGAGSIGTYEALSRLALFAEMTLYEMDVETSLDFTDSTSWFWETMPIYLWCAIHRGLDHYSQADANAHFTVKDKLPFAASNPAQIEDKAAAA